jgi:uncharacterized membrane protein YqaE (UPF0057 family)
VVAASTMANNKLEGKSTVGKVLLICACIVLPPLGIFLDARAFFFSLSFVSAAASHLTCHFLSAQEGCSTNFWIDCVLTLLFYIPGLIYALYIVFA